MFLGADRLDDRAGQFLADRVHGIGRRCQAYLAVGFQVLAQGQAVATIGLGPGDPGQAGAMHGSLEGLQLVQGGRRFVHPVSAQVAGEVLL